MLQKVTLVTGDFANMSVIFRILNEISAHTHFFGNNVHL